MSTAPADAPWADSPTVPFGARVTQIAADRPDTVAVIFAPRSGEEVRLTWADFDLASNRAANRLAAAGLGQGGWLVIALPNRLEHLIAAIGAWKLGASVLPLRWDLPDWERARVIDVAGPDLVVTSEPSHFPLHATISPEELVDPSLSSEPLPVAVPRPPHAIASSGSTGTPKVIMRDLPGEGVPGASRHSPNSIYLGYHPGQIQLIPAPLYHTNGFLLGHSALFEGQTVVLMERFDAAQAVDLIERHRVNTFTGVTIMLQRIARLPDIAARDLSSIDSVQHGGAMLPQWLARFWIDLIGPQHFFVCYGGSEMAGQTLTRGDIWLTKPGTVGKPFNSELKIFDEMGEELPPGEVGEIFMRWIGQTERSFAYRGAEPNTRPDLFSSFGDLGWVDEDGYLFLAERRKDLIITGGSNVFAAEVEAAITEHPGVDDVVVVGLTDEEWGQRVHAVVQRARTGADLDEATLQAWARERLAPYKVPKSIEFVDRINRSDAGKVRRSSYADRANPS